MGYFHALKLAFLTSLIRKNMLWEGFYHDFSTKKASASGGFAPWPPPRGSNLWTPPGGAAPWTPEVTSPPLTIYPGAAPVVSYYQELFSPFNPPRVYIHENYPRSWIEALASCEWKKEKKKKKKLKNHKGFQINHWTKQGCQWHSQSLPRGASCPPGRPKWGRKWRKFEEKWERIQENEERSRK